MSASTASPLLDRPGAVSDAAPDGDIAAHYGDPSREQRELAAGRAVVDLSNRGVVTVSGPDRLTWLTTLSSQRVADLQPGQTAQLLLLSIQGRIEFDALITDDGETAWLVCDVGQAEPLAAWLNSMKFMLRVEVSDVSVDWAVLAAAAEVEPFDDYTHLLDPWPHLAEGGHAYTATDPHPGQELDWHLWLMPRAELDDVVGRVEVSGVSLAGNSAAEALRIAAWRPRFRHEVDEKAIPHELDLLRTAVHLTKGCYKGQESVARVHNLGHPPRRLVFLHLDGSEHTLPAPGSEVRFGERAVGRVTSVAAHHEMGPIALAVVKRSVPVDEQLVVVDGDELYAAAQETVVAPDAGQVVGRVSGLLKDRRR